MEALRSVLPFLDSCDCFDEFVLRSGLAANGPAFVDFPKQVGAVLDVGSWQDLPFDPSLRNCRKVPTSRHLG